MQALLRKLEAFDWVAFLRPYTVAVVSTGTAIWLRTLLQPVLGEECPFSLFYLSVLLTASMAGTGPAILSLIMGTVSAAHFFIPPHSTIVIAHPSDLLSLGIYVVVNCVAIVLFSLLDNQRLVAERRSVENEQLSASLRRADERKDEFLALLAHELRNPLAPMRTNLVLLEKKGDSPEIISRVHSVFQRQIHHLVRIVDDLLDVSRFLRGQLQLQKERLDLRQPVQMAIEMTESLLAEKSHRLQVLMQPEPLWVEGDQVRLAQLTANILGNAAKYTPNSGRILVRVEQLDGVAQIVVSDNGIGFPPSERTRILEPFVQMDPSRTREYGGLGVGLAIVKQLVELHGGALSPESRGPGTGSTFTVSLPLVAPPEEHDDVSEFSAGGVAPRTIDATIPDESFTASAASSQHDFSAAPNRVLIVEDNRDAADSLCELLNYEGMQVAIACDGIAALKQIEQSMPGIIVLDIGLPGMDGYETARRIRQRWPEEPIRIIALTGWGSETDRQRSEAVGIDMHLVKPIIFSDLLALLQADAVAVR